MTTSEINVQTSEGQARLKELGIRPLPEETDLTGPFWNAARRHELVLQRCNECRGYQHPPRTLCRHCGGNDVRWERVSGRGTVYTFMIDHRLLVPGFDEPYVVALVVPDEAHQDDVRLTANLLDCDADEVTIGMRVEVTFQAISEAVTLPQFRPAR